MWNKYYDRTNRKFATIFRVGKGNSYGSGDLGEG